MRRDHRHIDNAEDARPHDDRLAELKKELGRHVRAFAKQQLQYHLARQAERHGHRRGRGVRSEEKKDGSLEVGRQPFEQGPACGPGMWRGQRAWRHEEGWGSPPSTGRDLGPALPWWRIQRCQGRLRRATEGRMLGGVAEGVGRRIGIDPTIVRVAFVLTTLSGFGLPAYVLGWLLLPPDNGQPHIAAKAIEDRRGLVLVSGLIPLAVAALFLSTELRAPWANSFVWPSFVALGGLILIWRNAPQEERLVLERAVRPILAVGTPGRSWAQVALWAVIGLGAISGGLAFLLHHRTTAALWPIAGVLLVLAGLVVLFGPWWLRIARDLVVERQARARAEERADMASRVHDSVLQTLAMIQKRADQPGQVMALARAQERELRSWLFEGKAPGSLSGGVTTFAEGVSCIERDVEAAHDIRVEAVVVGDCLIDDDVGALLEAAREAAVNAAKWSGAPVVSVFAEVGERSVAVFVRDRGAGFLRQDVPSDRKGVAESIEGRMARHGGSASVKSTPGEGTEVTLTLPRRRERQGSNA